MLRVGCLAKIVSPVSNIVYLLSESDNGMPHVVVQNGTSCLVLGKLNRFSDYSWYLVFVDGKRALATDIYLMEVAV